MDLLISDQVKLEIIDSLHKKGELSMNRLRENSSTTNYKTIKRSSKFLEIIGLIKINKKNVGSQEYSFIKLTEFGEEIAKKMEDIENVAKRQN